MAVFRRGASIAVLAVLAWANAAGAAPLATRTEMTVYQPVQHLSSDRAVEVRVYIPTASCDALPADYLYGTVTLERDGVVEQSSSLPRALYSFHCEAGFVYGWTLFSVDAGFGEHAYTAEYGGTNDFAPSVSVPSIITVQPDYEAGGLKAASSDPQSGDMTGFGCSTREVGAPATYAPPFPGNAPAATLGYKFTGCSYGCGFLCPPGVPSFPQQRVRIEMPGVPDGSAVWLYNAGWGQSGPTWRPALEKVANGAVDVYVTGNAGERDMVGQIAITNAPPPSRALQDIWWGGPAENGWGVSLEQDGDTVFGGFYVYGSDGRPVWTVMSGGAWNAGHTAITGDLYAPNGTRFDAYEGSRWRAGNALGSVTMTFTDANHAELFLRMGFDSVRKSIQRYAMAADTTPGSRAGMWWGGIAENGWGVQLQQQGAHTFAIWYTYGADGTTHWYAMTDGQGGADSVSGTLYETKGSAFLGPGYNAALFNARAVGTLSFQFDAADVGKMTYTVDGLTQAKVIYRFPL